MSWFKGLLVVVGAFVFAVTVSLALLNVMGLVQGNTLGNRIETLHFVAEQLGYAVAALAFLYLVQKPSGLTKVQASFRNRKWLLGIGALALAVLELLALQIPPIRHLLEMWFENGYPGAPVVLAIYLGLMFLLAKVVWRCPSCSFPLPFLARQGKGLRIEECPNCHTKLI